MKKKTILIIIGILFLLIIPALTIRLISPRNVWICNNGHWIKRGNPSSKMPDWFCYDKNITNFERCIEAGYSVIKSFPRECKGPNGKTFVENIGNKLDKEDIIKVDTPIPNQVINSPLFIKGRAKGSWFFEGNFPVKLYKNDGTLIAEGIAHTQENWNTEKFIEFNSKINFKTPNTKYGVVVLERDNPLKLEANNDELRVPVKFFE